MVCGKSGSERIPAILLALVLVCLFVGFWRWDLWAPDEPRYAEVAREALVDGHWLVPHLGGEPYADKPPLFFWLIAGSYSIFGITPFAVRIIPVLSACGTLLVTYALGRRLFDARTGLIAAVVLGTSVLFMDLARHGNIDSTLTLVTTSAMALMAVAHLDGRRRLWLPAYALMALGVLLKGPVAVLVPVLSFIVFLEIAGRRKDIGRMRLLPGLGLVVFIVAAWLVPAVLAGGSPYAHDVLIRHNVGRAVSSFSHGKPVYYYLLSFPVDFLPWVFFLPQAIVFAVRRRTPGTLLALAWFATVFVFFSAVSGKRGLYLLPLFPAAALLVGRFVGQCTRGEIAPRALDVPAVMLGVLLVVVAVALCFVRRLFKVPTYLDEPVGWAWLVALIAGLGGAALLLVVFVRRRSLVFPIAALTMTAVVLAAVLAVFPAMNANKTARFICADLLRDRRADEPVFHYLDPSRSGAYHFYTRLPIVALDDEAALVEALGPQENAYIILSRKDYNALDPETVTRWRLVAARQVGHRAMRVYRTGPPNEPAP